MSIKKHAVNIFCSALGSFYGSQLFYFLLMPPTSLPEGTQTGKNLFAEIDLKTDVGITESLARFYDPKDRAALELRHNPHFKNGSWQTDSTYAYTFNCAPKAIPGESVSLQSVVDSAAKYHKPSIIFTHSTDPADGYQLSVMTAKGIVGRQKKLAQQLDLDQDIPVMISSETNNNACATGTRHLLDDDDRVTVLNIGIMAVESPAMLNFTLGHEMGHHRLHRDSEGVMANVKAKFAKVALSTGLTDKKDLLDKTSRWRSNELAADSIGAKYSDYRTAMRALTSSYKADQTNIITLQTSLVTQLLNESLYHDETSTHPTDHLRLQKIYKLMHKPK